MYYHFCNNLIEEFKHYQIIGILGFGKEGQSSLAFLRKILPDKQFILADINPKVFEKIQLADNIRFITGKNYLNEFFSLVNIAVISPGIPLFQVKIPSKVVLTSQTDLVFRYLGQKIIAVTGTKGKSTTVSLITHILKQYLPNVVSAGNIGIPAFDIIEPDKDFQYLVLEVSSHQLQYIRNSPKYNIILNLYPEHLDYYPNLETYYKAKINLILFAKDVVFLNSDNSDLMKYTKDIRINAYYYSLTTKQQKGIWLDNNDVCFADNQQYKLFKMPETKQLGAHNLSNMLAATGICHILGIPNSHIVEGLSSFKPLAHRMQKFLATNGCICYDDSIATIPQASLAALQALSPVHTIILGGMNRGVDYTDFVNKLANFKLKTISCYGEVGKIIYSLLINLGKIENVKYFEIFKDAVEWALTQTPIGEKCLMSPAAPSYDQFKNFEQRGSVFQEIAKSHY